MAIRQQQRLSLSACGQTHRRRYLNAARCCSSAPASPDWGSGGGGTRNEHAETPQRPIEEACRLSGRQAFFFSLLLFYVRMRRWRLLALAAAPPARVSEDCISG